LPIGPSTQTSIDATTIHAKFNMGAFTVKGAKVTCTHIKYYSPMILKNDYMNYKDYNLMKSLSK
jgi:hypothetical protein